jgi:hypothetical protein
MEEVRWTASLHGEAGELAVKRLDAQLLCVAGLRTSLQQSTPELVGRQEIEDLDLVPCEIPVPRARAASREDRHLVGRNVVLTQHPT